MMFLEGFMNPKEVKDPSLRREKSSTKGDTGSREEEDRSKIDNTTNEETKRSSQTTDSI